MIIGTNIKKISMSLSCSRKIASRAVIMLCIVMGTGLHALPQVVRWAIRPEYSSIEQISADLYRAKKNGKVGLLRASGGQVVPITADSITNFVNGEALVLVISNGKYRIKTIVHSNGQMSDVGVECYTSRYSYFNDDLMMVTDKKGKIGYIDIYGHKIIDFKYKIAHPFSEGFAMVSTKRKIDFPRQMKDIASMSDKSKVFYIDHRGSELVLPKEMGDISFGSTFNGGVAVVKAKDGFYNINRNGEVQPEREEALLHKNLNNIYQLVDFVDEPSSIYMPVVDPDSPSIYYSNGLVGYMLDDEAITPPIFKGSSLFSNNHAVVVSANGGVGMVSFIDKPVEFGYRYTREDENQVEVTYVASVPDEFEYSVISLDFIPESNSKEKPFSLSPSRTEKKGDEIAFVFSTQCKRENYRVLLYADEIPIYFSSLNLYVAPPSTPIKRDRKRASKQEKRIETDKDKDKDKKRDKDKDKATPAKITISIKPQAVKANKDNSATVNITLTNSGGTKATVPITVSGASCSTKSVSLAPGASKTVRATISGIKSKGVRTVSVSAGSFGSSSQKITVRPFFEEF